MLIFCKPKGFRQFGEQWMLTTKNIMNNMYFIKRLVWTILNDRKALLDFLICSMSSIIPDALFLKWRFRLNQGYKLNLKNPKSFNEKLQWLKLYDHHPEYTELVDKISAKDYVAAKIGLEYLIPTLGTWNSVQEVNWDSLPSSFVIKNTGDSGGVIVCKDKNNLNLEHAKRILSDGMKTNYYNKNKEYPYKDVKPRIIAESYMEDESGYELKDYKFFCFNGEPKFLFVASDRQKIGEDTKFDFFDLNWNHIPVTNGHPNARIHPLKPANFDEMVNIAAKLSQGFPHIRVDLYNINGKIYFGELTFFHNSGLVPFVPQEWDNKFGEYLKLPV